MLVEKYISENKYEDAISECISTDHVNLAKLLDIVVNQSQNDLDKKNDLSNVKPDTKPDKTVRLLCNWLSSNQLREIWNKMSKGNYRWNNIKILSESDKTVPDYYVIINAPQKDDLYIPEKTIVFQMEPEMEKSPHHWHEWSSPDPKKFLKVILHKDEYNNNEWHLSKTYDELKKMRIMKTNNSLSTVLSSKYRDPGHIKRIDFVKFLEKKDFPVHVYGDNKWEYKDFKGDLPYHCKDNAMFSYKYVFNCENRSVKNYYTEKLIDGILAECLVFYSGCYNARDFINEKAFVYLELSNFEEDYKKIKTAIEEDWYTQRLPYIREAKAKIMDNLQFFPRLENILNSI